MNAINAYISTLPAVTRNFVDAVGVHHHRTDKELEALAFIPSDSGGHFVVFHPHVENPLSAAASTLCPHAWNDFLKRASLARKILAYGRENEDLFQPPSHDGDPMIFLRNSDEQDRVISALHADRCSVSNFINNTPAPCRTFSSFMETMKLNRDDVAHRRAVRQWASQWVESEVTRLLVYVENAGEFSRTVHCACGEQHALDGSDDSQCHFSQSQWSAVQYGMLLESDFARVFGPSLLASDARIDIWISYNAAGIVPDEYSIRRYPEWNLKEAYQPGWFRFCANMIKA